MQQRYPSSTCTELPPTLSRYADVILFILRRSTAVSVLRRRVAVSCVGRIRLVVECDGCGAHLGVHDAVYLSVSHTQDASSI